MPIRSKRRRRIHFPKLKIRTFSLPLIPTLSSHATASLLIALGGFILLISTLPVNMSEEYSLTKVLGGCTLLIFMLLVCFKIHRKDNINFWSLSAITISSITLMIDNRTVPGVLLIICGAIIAMLLNIPSLTPMTRVENLSTDDNESYINTDNLLNEYRILVGLIERLGNSYRSGEIGEYEYKHLFDDYISRLDRLKARIRDALIDLEKYRGITKRKLLAVEKEIALIKARMKIGEITQEEAKMRREYLEKERVKLAATVREIEEKISYLREGLKMPLLSIEEMYNKLVNHYSTVYNKPGIIVEREILKLIKEGFCREDAIRILYQRIIQEELE